MSQLHIAIAQRESYRTAAFSRFLWWLATAEESILTDCVVDRNRFRIIGMSVLATWAFASLAWSYFFYTAVSSAIAAIALGLFMGFIILTIDRALIKGISKFNKRRFLPLLFRGLLALTIGTFMAQPAVLYIFDKEIQLQTSLDNEQRKMTKQQQLKALYSNRKAELTLQKKNTQKALDTKYAEVEKARENFLAETDGSGGSGKVGIKAIALAKQAEYQKLDAAYQLMQKGLQPTIDSADAALLTIDHSIKTGEDGFSRYLNEGFLTRMEALNNLTRNNPALAFRYYLIVFILMLIELMPVIAKTMLPCGSYDEKLQLREAMEIAVAGSNIQKEQALKELYNQLAFDNDKAAITAFFVLSKEDRENKIKTFSKDWTNGSPASFDGFWEKVKKDILSKQEN